MLQFSPLQQGEEKYIIVRAGPLPLLPNRRSWGGGGGGRRVEEGSGSVKSPKWRKTEKRGGSGFWLGLWEPLQSFSVCAKSPEPQEPGVPAPPSILVSLGHQVSSAWAGRGLDAAVLEQNQVSGTVAAGHTGSVAWPDLIPVVTRFGAAWPACVIHSTMLTLGCWI